MTDLAFDDTGSGTPLVFLHGLAMTRRAWEPVVELLSGRHRCVNVDLAGHGDSPRTGAYDVFSQAALVEQLIGVLGLERPVLVGHSFGAFTATLGGATAQVRAVVNVDQQLDTAAFKESLAPFESRLRGDDFAAAFAEFTDTLGAELVPQERRDPAVLRGDPAVVLAVWTTVFDTPGTELNAMVEPVLTDYAVPYLAIHGSAISADERRLLEMLPEVEVEQWDGLGHFVHLVDPPRTAERIAQFVQGVA